MSTVLDLVDLRQRLTRAQYKSQLIRHQVAFRDLCDHLYARKRRLVVVFEGWDAAGKGSNIRRLTERLDGRGYEVLPIAAPSPEELAHHYLWRFWRAIRPTTEKQVLIFDRSWYGRVLVERVEGFCRESDWKRAYGEINDFEGQLSEDGLVVKFWLHVSKDEQLRRFEARQGTPRKQWKLTQEDWRNREKWDDYAAAVHEMILKTSSSRAPWRIIEGDDKLYARVKTLTILVELLAADLGLRVVEGGPRLTFKPAA